MRQGAGTGPAPLSRGIRTRAHPPPRPSSSFNFFSPNDPTPTTPLRQPLLASHHAPSTPLARTRPRAPASASPQLKLRLEIPGGASGQEAATPRSTTLASIPFNIGDDLLLSKPCRIGLRYEHRSRILPLSTLVVAPFSHPRRRQSSVNCKAQALPRQCSTHYDLSNAKSASR